MRAIFLSSLVLIITYCMPCFQTDLEIHFEKLKLAISCKRNKRHNKKIQITSLSDFARKKYMVVTTLRCCLVLRILSPEQVGRLNLVPKKGTPPPPPPNITSHHFSFLLFFLSFRLSKVSQESSQVIKVIVCVFCVLYQQKILHVCLRLYVWMHA